ncbi:MAG: TonB-dependent receptor [Lacunisphaera sp.]
MPLNDPFGGWVAWTKIPRESLAGAELVRGGGATAWGNAALGGIVQLFTAAPTSNLSGYPAESSSAASSNTGNPIGYLAGYGSGRISAAVGAFGTRSLEAVVNVPAGPGALQILGRDFSTEGFSLVAPEDRGSIDIPAASKHRWLEGRWRQSFASGVEAHRHRAHLRGGPQQRHAYQENTSDENFASVALAATPRPGFSWNGVAYGQDQTFSSTFSSVNATRTAETPASNQYDVPATAFGAAWTGVWSGAGETRTTAGLDYRLVRGETRENYTYSAGDFTRNRIAGGTQGTGGLFALHEWAPAADLRATLGGRVDFWSEEDGHRRENRPHDGCGVAGRPLRESRRHRVLAPAPGWCGPSRPAGASVRPDNIPSAAPPSTSSTGRSASAT